MKILCCLILFWIANDFVAGNERFPVKCGNDWFFSLYPNPRSHTPEDSWATGFDGHMFTVDYFAGVDHATWTIKYKTKSFKHPPEYKHMFSDNTKNWYEHVDSGHSIFTTIRLARDVFHKDKNTTTVLHLKPDNHLTVMELTFSAVETDKSNAQTESCSIENIRFKDCETDSPDTLLFHAQHSHYKSTGTFYCEDGTYMFPLNKSLDTVCMENAIWKNEHKLACCESPRDTRVEGSLDIKENEAFAVHCNFTQTTPFVDRPVFSFNGNISILPDLTTPFGSTVTIVDDGKEIWCQPLAFSASIAPFLDEGKSPTRKLHVLFSPRAVKPENHICNWTMGGYFLWGHPTSCEFTYKSRPMADYAELFQVRNKTLEHRVNYKFYAASESHNHTISIHDIDINKVSINSVNINNINRFTLNNTKFRLRILSSHFPGQNYTMNFQLVIYPCDETLQFMILGCTILLIIILTILVACICWKRRQHEIAKKKANQKKTQSATRR